MKKYFQHRSVAVSIIIAFLLGMFATAGVAAAKPQLFASLPIAQKDENNFQTSQQSPNQQILFQEPYVMPNNIAEIVEKSGPSVVKIQTTVEIAGQRNNPFANDPFFRQFFGDDFSIPGQSRVSRSFGSGFIISKDGYILTNQHVIDSAKEIEVLVVGYEEPFKAEVIGSDYDLDLALIKISAPKNLPFLPLGDSNNTQVGNWVIAIGNPYGLDHTVTVGIISAKGRPIDIGDRHYKNLLQTDASINPGNSGGPLLNLNGEVIGINTAINAQAQGIGFAIPTSTVTDVLEELKTEGKVTRSYLGVYLQEIDEEIAKYLNLKNTEGALIAGVISGSPADKAGLQRGDVVVEFNKKSIKSPEDLVAEVAKTKPGQKLVIVISRGGTERYVTVTMEQKPSN